MQHYIMPFLRLVLEMAPYLLLGFLVAGLLHAFVPQRFFTRYLSADDWRSTLWAAIIGVPLPLCSCGVIPTAMSLRRNGASKGATVSFLISTPQTGVDSILATGSLMGWPMAVLRPIAAFITAIFGGLAVNRFDHDPGEAPTHAETADTRPRGFKAKLIDTLRYGFVDMMQDIGRWLVIGLLIAGVITIVVPDNFFDGLHQWPLLNMLLVLAIAVPMYVCATGSIPIAVALMLKGLTPGAALVFLMAGPATNMAAIMVINKVLRRKSLIIYLATIVTGAILCGLAIDYLLPADWFITKLHTAHCCDAHDFPWWQVLSAALFAMLLANAFLRRHNHNHNHNHNHSEQMETPANNTHHFRVTGMACNHCKANVERAVAALPGVETYEVDLPTGALTVTGPIDPAALCAAITSLGYTCTPT